MTESLEEFKQDIIEGYVYPYMDRLLDLMNIIKKAKSFDEIGEALEHEKKFLERLKNGT